MDTGRTNIAADEALNLPEDIIFLILTRLPVKYVIGFRTVCKLWNSLISNPRFTGYHQFIASRCNPVTFLVRCFKPSPIYPLMCIAVDRYAKSVCVDRDFYDGTSIKEFSCTPSIVGDACDGVFCVSYGENWALWNPATREVRVVEFDYRGCLKLDLNKASCFCDCYCYGFGSVKDERCNVVDFKLVFIVTYSLGFGAKDMYFLVYSLRTNLLSLVEFPNLLMEDMDDNIAMVGWVCFNGVLYWLAESGEGAETAFILTFDLVSETFGQIDLPNTHGIDDINDGDSFLTVVDNQYLAFGRKMFDPVGLCRCLNMWTLCEIDGQRSWIQHEKTSFLGLLVFMLKYCDRIGGVITQSDINGRFWYHVDGNARVYDTGLSGCTYWFEYSESLVSLKRIANDS